MGELSEGSDRWVPTPEELEEGVKARRRRDRGASEESVEKPKQKRFSLLRKLGVGRSRRYVEVEPSRATPKSRESVEGDRAAETPSQERGTTRNDPLTPESEGRRVESVRLPKRTKKPAKPKYAKYSKEARFYTAAERNGHQMGELEPVPHSSNYYSRCTNCGLEGELVIQHEENYANQTYELPRGPAIERRCTEARGLMSDT